MTGHHRRRASEAPRGRATRAGRQPRDAAMHPGATTPMETPRQHCPPPTAVPPPRGRQQNPRKPNQRGELVYGIYSVGAFTGKNAFCITGEQAFCSGVVKNNLSPPKP